MAIVKKLDLLTLGKDSKHTDVNCTYSIISDEQGKKYLQIDTTAQQLEKFSTKKANPSDSALKRLNR